MFLGLVALMGGLAGCEDRITEEEIPVDSGKLVTVPLTFDFAPETEGYEIASGSPRARLGLASGSPRAPHRLRPREGGKTHTPGPASHH